MTEDTGPLPLNVRESLASMAVSEVCSSYSEKNDKNVSHKIVALQKVNKIMNNKPWVLNRVHIEELRRSSLSLSEIVHSLLIMAHYQAVAAISTVLRKIKENKEIRVQKLYKSDSLTKRRLTKGKKNNECSELFRDKEEFKGERYILDERLCGISCQRYWDDFGFSVLNCLDEQSSTLLDNRFSFISRLRNRSNLSEKRLRAIVVYTQNILGFDFVEHKKSVNDLVLNQDNKSIIEQLIFSQDVCDDITEHLKEKEIIEMVVTVLETKLQAEIIYALNAVTQFMNW